MEVVGYKLKADCRVKDKVERMIVIVQAVISVVRKAIEMVGIDNVVVAIEDYAYGAKGKQIDLAELQGTVKSQLWIGCSVEPVLTVGSHARMVVFGRGGLSLGDTKGWTKGKRKRELKKKIVGLLNERGVQVSDHNIADAYVIADSERREILESKEKEL